MLNPIKTLDYIHSIKPSNIEYSFSQLAKNINNIAFPAIVLAGIYTSKVCAEKDSCRAYSKICSVYSNHDDCINFCLKESSQYENLIQEMSECVHMCSDYFPT